MTKIKICGLTSFNDIEVVNQYRPDYIGFVFAKSRRQISDELAKKLRARVESGIQVVGVFVNDTISHITNLCMQGTIDVIQLHGDEDNEYIRVIRQNTSVPVIKADRLENRMNAEMLQRSVADYILFDSFTNASEYGGTGKPIDLSLLPSLIRPTFLAGGINETSVQQIIETYHPYCIDVSSSVETNGKKDPEKIIRMIQAVRKSGGR